MKLGVLVHLTSDADATFKQVAEGQTFTFDSPVTTSKIVFKNMVSPDNNKWSGFTEIAVTGTEIA